MLVLGASKSAPSLFDDLVSLYLLSPVNPLPKSERQKLQITCWNGFKLKQPVGQIR